MESPVHDMENPMDNAHYEPRTPEQQLADRVEAIEGLDILIEHGGSDLLINSYRAQRAWLVSIDDGSTNQVVDALKSDYFRQHKLYAASVY